MTTLVTCLLFSAIPLVGLAMGDKLNCGAELRFYNHLNCEGDIMEAWTFNGNGHSVKLNQRYGSPDAPALLSIGWDKAANTMICLGTADVGCLTEVGNEDDAADSQCMSLEHGCDSSDCWSPFGTLYADHVTCMAKRGHPSCAFSSNW